LAEKPSDPRNGQDDDSVRRRRRWRFVAAGLLLLLIAARVALPAIARQALERTVSDALHVDFSVEDVGFELLEAAVVVEGIAMRAAEKDLARVARVTLDMDWGGLIVGELRAERIAIDEPRIFFEIDESRRFNWDAIGGPSAQASEVEAAASEPSTFHVTCALLEIGSGTFEFVNRLEEGPPEVGVAVGALRLEEAKIAREAPGDPVRWTIAGANARDSRLGVTPIGREKLDFDVEANAGPLGADGSIPFELSMQREGVADLSLNGTIRPAPLAFELALELNGLSSRSLAPLVLRGVDVDRGTAKGSLVLKLDLSDVPKRGLTVTGNVVHEDLALHLDDEPAIDVVVERFSGEIDEIWLPIFAEAQETPQPVRVAWKRIELTNPSIDVWPGVGGNGAGKPAAAPDPDADSREAPEVEAVAIEPAVDGDAIDVVEAVEVPPAALDLTIASLSLNGGRLVAHDPNLGEHSEQVLSDIQLAANGVHWPPTTAEHAKLTVGSLGSKPFRIEGPIRADGAELAIRGTGIKLVPWNPLISHYSDYSINGGSLAIRSDFKLVDGAYESPTRLTVHEIRATTDGSGFQRTFGIPLSAATALLSDPSGDIDLKIDVNGRLGADGSFLLGVSLVDAVREGIMNALTSVIASPFAFAGSALVRGHELAFLRIGEAVFEPASETLDPTAIEELDRAAEFVAKSPDAKLELVAEVVNSDLEAKSAKTKRSSVFRSVVAAGAALFQGRRELDSKTYLFALDLAKARMQAAADHITAKGLLAPERVVQAEWNESVAAGSPRVVLRLDMSPDEEG